MYIVQRIVKRTQTQLYKYHQLTNKVYFSSPFPFSILRRFEYIYIYISSRLIYITLSPSNNYFFCTFRHFTFETFMGCGFYSTFLSSCFFFNKLRSNDKRKNPKNTLRKQPNHTKYRIFHLRQLYSHSANDNRSECIHKIIYLITNSCFVDDFF